MTRKIAIKRLSASDLTFFEFHFRRARSKQKAINLDEAVFVEQFYPGFAATGKKAPVQVSIDGPGIAPPQSLTLSISKGKSKSAKNWRLNGLVYNPVATQDPYSALKKGDYAVMEFLGDTVPESVSVRPVAADVDEDRDLHAAIGAMYGSKFSGRKGMTVADPVEIDGLLAASVPKASRGPGGETEADYLEDAVQGGFLGFSMLRKQRERRPITKAEFKKSKDEAERVGRLGEELVNAHLSQQKKAGTINDFEWTSDRDPFAPYDFLLTEPTAGQGKIDVKSTSGKGTSPVHVSSPELREMMGSKESYRVYRLHSVTENRAVLRVSKDLRELAMSIGDALGGLPQGVMPDGFSIAPSLLDLGPETEIAIPAGDEKPEE